MPVKTVHSFEDLNELRATIAAAAGETVNALRDLCGRDPIEVLHRLKFSTVGRHPLEDRRLNLIEQVNQTFTYLASLAAAEVIAQRHPGAWPIELRLGTASGSDVSSSSASVAAEVYAAVHPDSNDKRRKDIEKVRKTSAQHKYVFVYSPGHAVRQVHDGVKVERLTSEQVLGPRRK
ncbi:MAG TPA: hypothetical protein VNO86_09580 [Candidatus Binatia bacterium]|nr:hypothetical protein [Candidatus Binatia bacterium]